MIEIHCNASPFVFKPIVQLLNRIKFVPKNTRECVIFAFLDPFNQKSGDFKAASHLTDAQTKDEQIRYLGNLESTSKMIHLAYALGNVLKKEQIIFKLSPYFEIHPLFDLFLKHLTKQSECAIYMHYTKDEGEAYRMNDISSRIETLFYSSESKKINNGAFMFDAALTCINAGDYYSAIKLLDSIRGLPHEDGYFENEILCHLAIAHGAIGELKQAVFYWNQVFKSENKNHKNRSSYALGLMYLRHLPKQFQDLELGEEYINAWYQKLVEDQTSDRTRNQIDQVFNRNGYALAAFKRGNIDEAEKLVTDGIATLEEIGSSLSMFHQSVLYYNLAQCFKAKKDLVQVEKTLEKLIEIDQKFCLYHEYLVEFYIENKMLEKALTAIEEGFKVDSNHIPFHFLKGKVLNLQGDKNAALLSFEQAYDLNPFDTGTLAYLTSIYNEHERYAAVLNCLKTFHFKFSNDQNGELIINNLIIALLNSENSNDQVDCLLKESINLKPESSFFQEITNLLNEEYVD